jgi:LPXTG-motif cell wall-anchored protein
MVRFLLIASLMFSLFACASSPEPAPPRPTPPVAEPAPPPPAPPPVYEPPPPVRELPKTASSLPALGLAGLAALGGAGVLHRVRIRIR